MGGPPRSAALELQAAYPVAPATTGTSEAEAHERALAALFMEIKCAPRRATRRRALTLGASGAGCARWSARLTSTRRAKT